MSGTVRIVASLAAENDTENFKLPLTGSAQKTFEQTNPGGGNPGAVDVTESEVDISFGNLDSPAFVRMENLSNKFAVTYGPKNAGVMVAAGRLREAGGVALFELEPGVTLRMVLASDSISSSEAGSGATGPPSARVQITATEL